jgi:predicted dehydrogenase
MKTDKQASIVIIGFGSIGRRHYGNLLDFGYENITVFDPSQGAFAQYSGIRKLEKLSEEELKKFGVAFVCSPNNLHINHAIMCARAGCHVFIEKPLSHNLKDIGKLIDILKRNKTINMVACNMRFHPCLNFIKNYLDKGEMGKIFSIKHEFGYYLPDWRPAGDYTKGYAAKKATGGGIILDDIHEFDLLFWLNNFEKVEKSKFIFEKASDLEIQTEDICLASFKFKNKILGLASCDYLQRKYSRSCKIVGERGNLKWDFNENIVRFESKEGDKKLFEAADYKINQMYIDEVKYFFECLKKNRQTFNGVQAAFGLLKYCVERK